MSDYNANGGYGHQSSPTPGAAPAAPKPAEPTQAAINAGPQRPALPAGSSE